VKKTLYVFVWACSVLLALPANAQVPAYVPTDGLVGWWPFNGNANDESGNGNDGVVNGQVSLSTDRSGNSNSAYSFPGNSSSYIDCGNNPSLQISGEISLCAWIYMDGGNIVPRILSFEGNGNAGYGLMSATSSNDPRILWSVYYDGSGNGGGFCCSENTGVGPIACLEWHYLVYTHDLDGVDKYYIDGELNGTRQGTTTQVGNYVNSLNIGRKSLSAYDAWGGLLDDIAIYNRALSQEEITALFTGEPVSPPAACTPLPANLQEGLVGYWPFCGNANDESGNGNDGTVNGATLTEDRFGNAESSFSFNGIDQYLNLGSFNPFISSGSINVWINESNGTEGLNYIISKFDGSSPPWPDNSISRSWMLYRHNPQYGSLMTFELSQDGEYAVNVFSDFQGVSGTWTCLTVTFELGVIKFYKNGILMSQSSAPMTSVYSSETPVLVGISAQGSGPEAAGVGGYFDGLIDDIGIWNRALTPEEVQELYTLDACTFTVYDTSYVTVYDTLTTYETVYDTLYTYETIYDTVTTFVTVTDTLLIDITFTGIEGQPSWLNTVTVFPNPASDHITIDFGNFALLAGYNTIITDAAGATVYSSAVNSQQAYIDINGWGAAGVYYLTIYDAGGAPVAVRHIVLQ
jgi:hypothetical protein